MVPPKLGNASVHELYVDLHSLPKFLWYTHSDSLTSFMYEHLSFSSIPGIHVRCRGETVVSFVDAERSVRAWVPDSITTRKAAKQARSVPANQATS